MHSLVSQTVPNAHKLLACMGKVEIQAFPHLSSVTRSSLAAWVDRECTREKKTRQTRRAKDTKKGEGWTGRWCRIGRPSELNSRNKIVKNTARPSESCT